MSWRKSDPKFVLAYERGMLRSTFKSLFWGIISEKKKRDESFTLVKLAKDVATSKHEVSRWFNGDPNWTINTIASLANALDVDVTITATDRVTGQIFTASGPQKLVADDLKLAEKTSARIEKERPANPLTFDPEPNAGPVFETSDLAA